MGRNALRIAALAAAAMLAPCAADANDQAPAAPYYDAARDRGDGYERIQYRDGYDHGADRRDDRDDRRPRARRAADRDQRAGRCDRGTTGTLVGAIAGGLLGNAAVGRHGSNAADRGC